MSEEQPINNKPRKPEYPHLQGDNTALWLRLNMMEVLKAMQCALTDTKRKDQ